MLILHRIPRIPRRSIIATLAALALFGASAGLRADSFLFDFGADATPTVGGQPPPPVYWNNFTGEGSSDTGFLLNLVTTNNTATDLSILMVSRFNGANENGTTTGNTNYPPSATRDSLFGNTEGFSGLTNITPIFKLSGLGAGTNYALTFFASRTGVTDNRETRYTVTGATTVTRDLNPANNVTNTVTVPTMAPDANGEITIALTPGPNNNNTANHFVYLGILQIDPSVGERIYVDFGSGTFRTDPANDLPTPSWNNVTTTIGTNSTGSIAGIITTNGTPTGVNFQMVSRFNGVNTAGSTVATVFPTTATSDTLFGNVEAFGGLANVTPVFKLAGLDAANVYRFTFYASRTGVTDNREARYTVSGSTTNFADLNASNNTNNTVTVSGMRPNDLGEISITVTPGANNNNTANHFAYLGVMKVDFEVFREPQILIDFGATGRLTTPATDPLNVWNNLTTVVGQTDNGVLTNLVMTGGSPTPIGVQMISRFNGVNENGTAGNFTWPATATQDSLFGNNEGFGGLTNTTPIFKLIGLNQNTAYKFTLFASRTGVADNRETRYVLTGASAMTNDLNIAANEFEVAVFENVFADTAGELRFALTPGPNNNNANHFTYLGVMQIDWSTVPYIRASFTQPAYANGSFTVRVNGVSGKTYKIQRTFDFTSWEDTGVSVTLTGAFQTATIPQTEARAFYRAVEQ